jgi:dipeptidyl aminopeptidase/acylaminoacyl peptidase
MKAIRLALCLLLGGASAESARAQAKPAPHRLTIEDALRWRIPSNPVLSPDGKRAAYLVSENDFEKSLEVTHLWWVDTQTRQARRLTQTEEGAVAPLWSPDGHWLAFLSARSGGVEGPAKRKRQVWLLPVDGGEAFALTRAPEGVLHYRWAPDSKSVYFVAREPLPKAAEEFRGQQQKRKIDAVAVNEQKYRKEVWRAFIEERKLERIFPGDFGLDSFEPSPDGQWIVYRTNYTGEPDDTRKYDLWLLEVAKAALLIVDKTLIIRDSTEDQTLSRKA